jgi:F420-0:gamma-glutamyl ligase
MRVSGIKTRRISAGNLTTSELLDESINELKENSVIAITSKVVGICEGRVVPIGQADKDELVRQEAEYYLPKSASQYNYSFTITHGTLIPVAGIDESNGDGNYILWPEDPQASANQIHAYLQEKFGVKNLGVIITDSTARPLHYGTEGVCIAFSGFATMNDYRGKPDLFGRPFKVSISNVADALASAAVLVMGEGTEQTPIAIVEDIPFVTIKEDDLFAPFLSKVDWQKGKN